MRILALLAVILCTVPAIAQRGEWSEMSDEELLRRLDPESFVLSFWQIVGLSVGVALIVFWMFRGVQNRLDDIDDKIASIGLSLEHLEPLVKEGRAIWEFQTERELDILDQDLSALDDTEKNDGTG